MIEKRIARYSLALALGVALFAGPAQAQGKGHGRDAARDRQEQSRPELRRRSEQEQRRIVTERERQRQETLRREQSSRGRSRDVPPGWCVSGNPHNTVENCGYSASRSRNRDDYDDRRGSYGDSGSYGASHQEFHRYLDRKYRELAAQRPLDISRQLRLRADKQREHDDWHRRAGRSH
jgi:hypothetical protein